MPDRSAIPSYLDPQALAAIAAVDLRARIVVDGFMQGLHRSPMQGVSVEFAQHRPYVPGDDIRRLDWKVYARTDKLYLKQYQRETNLDLVVLIDASRSMHYRGPAAPWRKYDAAATLAASLTKLAIDQRDRAAVWLFDDHVTAQSRLANARGHLSDVASVLTQGQPTEHAPVAGASDERFPTDLGRVLERANARLQHRAIIALVSDLFDDPDRIEHGLARLRNRRHDVIVIQTLDPAEASFDFRSPTEFVDLESDTRLPLDPAALRSAYLESFNAHLAQVERATRRLGFDYLRLTSDQPVGPALSHFMARRAAALSKSV